MKKVCYTAITGGYDKLKSPAKESEGWEYYCFTDSKDFHNDVYKPVHIPTEQVGLVRAARKPKIAYFYFPQLLEADVLVWHDANVQVVNNLDTIVSKYHKGGITVMDHPNQQSVQDEARTCLMKGRDKPSRINTQMKVQRQDGFPEDRQVFQTGFMVRDNTDPIMDLCRLWWYEVRKFSIRDQLALPYVLWKKGIRPNVVSSHILKSDLQIDPRGHRRTHKFQ